MVNQVINGLCEDDLTLDFKFYFAGLICRKLLGFCGVYELPT